MNMDENLVQTVRQAPLFAGLKDDQLDCIRCGEVIEVQAGAMLVQEEAPAEFFFLNLEGEIRIYRRYDNQEVLLGVNKPGMYMGEIPLLLDAPWHRSEEHTSELQSLAYLVCRLLLEKK